MLQVGTDFAARDFTDGDDNMCGDYEYGWQCFLGCSTTSLQHALSSSLLDNFAKTAAVGHRHISNIGLRYIMY